MAKKNICIIGAGIGGLSTALLLAAKGYKVDVYEKNPQPGGKAGEYKSKGYRFDTGPTLITMKFVLEKLFKKAKLAINEYLEIKKLKVNSRYFFTYEKFVDFYTDYEKFIQEVKTKLLVTREELSRYLLHTEKIYYLSKDQFLYNPLNLKQFFFNKNFLKISQLDATRSMHQANKFFFKENEQMVKILNRYATYNGSNPYQAPATLNQIFFIENIFGGYYVKSGISQIPKALEKACKKLGVNFFYKTQVTRIIKEGNIVKGIKYKKNTKSRMQSAYYDQTVSNVDVEFTKNTLLNQNKNILSKLKPSSHLAKSSSAVIFMWGIKNHYSRNLQGHNILFSKDYKKEFQDIFKHHIIPEDPTVYINISSKYNTTDAPKNGENWFVMINVPSTLKSSTYWNTQNKKKTIDWLRKVLLSKIISTTENDIHDKVILEKVLTPIDLEQNTNSTNGSLYGISSNNQFSAFFRQQNKDKKYKNLYFCGGTSHPGGGIPLVILSGINVYRKILKTK